MKSPNSNRSHCSSTAGLFTTCAAVLFGALMATTSGACAGDSGPTAGTGDAGLSDGTGGPGDCDACDPTLHYCECWQGGVWVSLPSGGLCGVSNPENTCSADCHTEFGNNPDSQVVNLACSDNANSGSCASWDPADEITLTSGVYHMDYTFVAGLVANAAPLWTCDDAYMAPLSAGYFTVRSANADEFLYEAGLRNSDILLTLNGHSLEFYSSVASAFTALWSNSSEDEFLLRVTREGKTKNLYYELD